MLHGVRRCEISLFSHFGRFIHTSLNTLYGGFIVYKVQPFVFFVRAGVGFFFQQDRLESFVLKDTRGDPLHTWLDVESRCTLEMISKTKEKCPHNYGNAPKAKEVLLCTTFHAGGALALALPQL